MKNVFFFIPFLLIMSVSLYNDAFAQQTVTGYDYFDVLNPDGSHTWSTHHPFVLDSNNNYVPFIQNNNSVETAVDTVTLNPDGSYTWEEKGITDMIIAKYADISDLNSWTYPNGLNNATPEISWNGTAFVSEKNNDSIGNLKYIYSLDGLKWKTQLEAKNLSSLETKVFGFDQIVDLDRDTIKFGGIVRNLDNFDGQTFDKEFLDNNEGKVLDLLNGATFDFDLGYENLHSITVYDTGVNSSRLIFDYRTDNVLLPGETLIIDPTFGYVSNSDWQRILGLPTSTDCNSVPTPSKNQVNRNVRTPSTGAGSCITVGYEFDISSIVDPGVTVTSMNLRTDSTLVGTGKACDLVFLPTTAQPSASTAAALHAGMYAGTVIAASDDICTTAQTNKVIASNAGGLADASTRINSGLGWMAIGIKHTVSVVDGTNYETSIDDMELEITYDNITPPDSITDLTLDSATTTTAVVSFTAPNLNGGNLTTYTFNLSTPQTDNVKDFFGNSTDNPFTFTGLISGTSYSANATAITEGGGNYTLANVLNFTTYELPDGSLAITSGNIGDTLRLINTITMSDGEPLPLEATAQKVYQNNTLVQTVTISENIPTLGVPVALDDVWYRITVDGVYEYALAVVVTNDAGSQEIFSSSNVTLSREYNPSYLPAIDSPSTQGDVNATVTRFDDQDDLLLHVNRIGVSTGQTWQIECIAQTNAEAAQTKNQTQSWQGTWSNQTNTGYFNTTFSGFTNSHAYVTCFNEDLLFTLTDFTDSSLALLGIQLFDESYGSMIGVPVGIFFLVMTAGMANKRTAPTFIILITGMAGTMATIGFFSFEPLVWGLALVTAMLGIFVNQKIF